jgi:hypothetical protein
MKRIYKYPLEVTDRQELLLPKEATILTVQIQYGYPRLWVLVEPEAEVERWEFLTIGTGHNITSPITSFRYIGTYQLDAGQLVFHVFAKKNLRSD